MEAMKEMPDKAFELAIVDPDYGLNDKLTCGGTWAANRKKGDAFYGGPPNSEYFSSLFRVSINQIVWGGNYFKLPPSRCFIVWDKPSMRMPTMADCEYAWASFDAVAKIKRVNQEKGGKRIHICQKPVALYKWLLKNYAKQGDKILDTHGGSMSIAIACYDLGFDLELYEIDEDYFREGKARYERHIAQGRLFEPNGEVYGKN